VGSYLVDNNRLEDSLDKEFMVKFIQTVIMRGNKNDIQYMELLINDEKYTAKKNDWLSYESSKKDLDRKYHE